jgi:O-antigen/teichoic acid export membrane protein
MAPLKQQAVLSVKWNAISQVFRLSLYFLTSVILARLLQPDDFGLLGMATVFTSLIAVFNDFGLGSAIVQKSEPDNKTLSGIFWMTIGIGFLAMAITILSAPWIASFYRQEKLQTLLYFLSVSFLLTSMGQIQLSLLMKQIEFRQIAIIESISVLIGSLVAVVLAFLNQGVWALAGQIISTSAVTTICLWYITKWHPSLKFDPTSLRGVLKYSSGLFGFNLLNYFSRNADYFLIGKFLGAAFLGQYTFAYRLMQFPLQNIAGVVNRVLFPTLAQVKENDELFRRGFIKASQLVAIVTFPLMVGVFCLAPELTIVIFSAKWQPAIPVIQVLALIGLVQSIGGMVGNIYTAKGKTNWLFYWGIISSIIIVAGIAIGLRWGILGVAIGYACAAIFLAYPNIAIPFRLIGLRVADYARAIKTQSILAALMGIVVFTSASLQRQAEISQVVILVSNVLLGASIYIIAVIRFDRNTLVEFLNAVLGKYSARILNYIKS